MAEPADKLARYQGCANWHTWHVVRQLADVAFADVTASCTPDELRWLAHHRTPAVANGVVLELVDWDDVWKQLHQ